MLDEAKLLDLVEARPPRGAPAPLVPKEVLFVHLKPCGVSESQLAQVLCTHPLGQDSILAIQSEQCSACSAPYRCLAQGLIEARFELFTCLQIQGDLRSRLGEAEKTIKRLDRSEPEK